MSTASTSALSQRWIFSDNLPGEAAELSRSAELPLVVAELLTARGVRTLVEVERFLAPSIDHLLDPGSMLGMTAAVKRVEQAILRRETVLIYGDYDVDGTTAVVLLKTAIEMLGGVVRFHVPHRLREGYGMQREVLELAASEGVQLVISVDTGIRAFAAAEAAATLGIDLIVTDHHLPDPALGLPPALAVLNPNQPSCGYECKHLCGAGVAFKLAQALLESPQSGLDKQRVRSKLLPSFLKMLAIATVADAVPLVGENRVIAALGLEELRRPVNPGLRALMQVAQIDPARKLTAMDIGFRLGPRINAAGRMDIASDVVELFTTRNPQRAQELAAKLEQLNIDRRQTEAQALDEILQRIEEDGFRDARCIVIDGDGWHRGVIGILASRIVDRVGKPALVLTNEDGEAYGSGRSIAGFHLLEAIESCRTLFTRFGGHAHAVGFSLPSERVPELRERLTAYAAEHISENMLGAPLLCHAMLELERITPALFSWIRRLEPLGMGNEDPVFVARNVRIASAPRYMKEQHLRLRLAQGTRGASFPALGWRWAERAQKMGLAEGQIIHVAYRLRENEHPEFGGLELEIADIDPAA